MRLLPSPHAALSDSAASLVRSSADGVLAALVRWPGLAGPPLGGPVGEVWLSAAATALAAANAPQPTPTPSPAALDGAPRDPPGARASLEGPGPVLAPLALFALRALVLPALRALVARQRQLATVAQHIDAGSVDAAISQILGGAAVSVVDACVAAAALRAAAAAPHAVCAAGDAGCLVGLVTERLAACRTPRISEVSQETLKAPSRVSQEPGASPRDPSAPPDLVGLLPEDAATASSDLLGAAVSVGVISAVAVHQVRQLSLIDLSRDITGLSRARISQRSLKRSLTSPQLPPPSPPRWPPHPLEEVVVVV